MATYTIDKIQYNNGDTYLLQDSGALQLTGGSITGPVNFGDSVTMNEATLSELTISGAATIVNNLQVSSINGVTVGNTPKFTDTTYSSLTAASGGTSVSLVTTGEKYTWNNKTSNTGTVTSITLTQGDGISIGSSGTAITSTGTRTISLANNYGDTKNPYASKTKNYVLAAPSTGNGVPGFRTLVTDDLPHDTEILNTATDDKIPTSLAVKKSLGYVTPQMFGAYADGTSDNPHDDTDAIQAALNASLEVYFPPGVYMVSSTLEIQNNAHIWGVMGFSKIRAIKNGFTIVNSQPTYMLQQMNAHGHFLIESLEFDCNDTANVCGFRFLSPYNSCVIRDCIVNKCGCFGINVGDPGAIDSSHRSQTLVVDNCLFLGSDTLTSTSVLGYFRNAYELNLKDSKFMFSSAKRGDFCVEINNSLDVYVRGCSFVHGSNGIKLTEACRYFRLIANTYEDLTTIPISLDGTSSAYVERGLIMETVYVNVPKQIMMSYSRYIIIIGSFSTISKDANCQHITLLDMYNSDGTLPDKSAIEDRLNYRLQNTQQFVLSYSIATQTNSSVSPWGAFRSTSIASDISAYGIPVGVVAKAPANNNPAHACLVGTNLNAYSATAGTVVVYVTYNAFSSAMTPWT